MNIGFNLLIQNHINIGVFTKKSISIFLAALTLVSCTKCPVLAINTETGERYYGTATASGGKGEFELSNAIGVTCDGTYTPEVVFDYTTGASSRGEFLCSDGKAGTWVATGTAVGGQGEGQLGGQAIRIYYGSFASEESFR